MRSSRQRADQVVAGLAECQEKIGTGYLSAFPEEFIDRVEAGKHVWAPWYTLHKIYAGLLDMSRALRQPAGARGRWRRPATGSSPAPTSSPTSRCSACCGNEHGGMNEVLAELYAVTGDEKYLKLSRRFNHQAVLDPLAQRQDKLTGLHANTQFPKIIGAARQYELTGEDACTPIATFFWDVVTKERSYVIGGNSDDEHFSPKEELSKHLGPSPPRPATPTTCSSSRATSSAGTPRPSTRTTTSGPSTTTSSPRRTPRRAWSCYYVPLKTG